MELENQIKSIADAVQKLQEVQDGKFKESEGSRKEQEARLENLIADMQEANQKMAALETALNRPGAAEESKGDVSEMAAKAFEKLMRKGEASLNADEVKALSAGTDPDGGYLVNPATSSTIVTRIFESSPLRQLATVETISTDSLEFLIDDNEANAVWVGELDSRNETSTPDIGKLVIPVHEMYAEPRASQKLLDDAAVNIEQWLAGKVADKFARVEATAFVTGNGILKPRGFATYDAWAAAGVYERNKIEQINSGSSGAFTADGLIELQNSVKDVYQNNAVFMMKRASFSAIRKLKDNANQYLLGIGIGGLNNAQQMTILGKPVVFADDMPGTGANNLAAAYGDFRAGYTIVDRIGIRVLRDAFTAKPYIKFYTTKRVGGGVTNFEAIKLQRLAN